MRQHKHDYDAFISHAVEDKIPIANELCAKLERAGLRVWYSGKELGIGDSIEKTIENGLHRSRYGIVILSPTYLAKNWTIREFYTLLAKEIEQQKVILPVLYNVTPDDLRKKDLLMADRFAVNADRGIDHVVDRLVREIRKPKLERVRSTWFSRIWLILILSLLANVALVVKGVLPTTDTAGISMERPQNDAFPPVMNAALLNEMHGFFSQLSQTCECNRSRAQPIAKARQMAQSAPQFQRVAYGSRPNVDGGVSRRKPAKMTMAVVFQIEAPSETDAEQEAENQFNDMTETISLADNAFITVANGNAVAATSDRPCLHVGEAGE